MYIVQWCNDNQGFLMAFLTLIYVVATVFILVANSKSTRIMRKSLLLTDRIQKENAKLALHTTRLDTFDKLNQMIIKIHEKGPKGEYIEELLKICKTMYYVFDDSIDTLVKKIVFDIQKLRRIQYEYRTLAKSRKEKESLDEHEQNIHNNILKDLNELTEKVNEYLDIGDFGMDTADEETPKDKAKSDDAKPTKESSDK